MKDAFYLRNIEAYAPTLDWVANECNAFIETLPTDLADVAHAYLERMNRSAAQIEWYAPLWLGEALGVPVEQTRQVAVTNVLGMVYIRIHNDLMDGEPYPADSIFMATLAPSLYTRCIQIFAKLFTGDSPFWHYLGQYLNEWGSAYAWERRHHWLQVGSYSEQEIKALTAGKGAPEKICCAALALLANREDVLPTLETVIDLRSATAQLLDDMQDWREDWSRGRYNIFLTTALSAETDRNHSDLTENDLLKAIYRSADVLCLFDWTQSYAQEALALIEPLQCEPLSALCQNATQMVTHYRAGYLKERDEVLFRQLARLAGTDAPISPHTSTTVTD